MSIFWWKEENVLDIMDKNVQVPKVLGDDLNFYEIRIWPMDIRVSILIGIGVVDIIETSKDIIYNGRQRHVRDGIRNVLNWENIDLDYRDFADEMLVEDWNIRQIVRQVPIVVVDIGDNSKNLWSLKDKVVVILTVTTLEKTTY